MNEGCSKECPFIFCPVGKKKKGLEGGDLQSLFKRKNEVSVRGGDAD
jgi:hypothetical protein